MTTCKKRNRLGSRRGRNKLGQESVTTTDCIESMLEVGDS